MERITNLLGKKRTPPKKTRRSERGDIYDIIISRLNPDRAKKGFPPLTHGRLAYLLTGVPTHDLYALLSRCNDAERRDYPWGAIFWREIKPQKQL